MVICILMLNVFLYLGNLCKSLLSWLCFLWVLDINLNVFWTVIQISGLKVWILKLGCQITSYIVCYVLLFVSFAYYIKCFILENVEFDLVQILCSLYIYKIIIGVTLTEVVYHKRKSAIILLFPSYFCIYIFWCLH